MGRVLWYGAVVERHSDGIDVNSARTRYKKKGGLTRIEELVKKCFPTNDLTNVARIFDRRC